MWNRENKVALYFWIAFALLVIVRFISYDASTKVTRTSERELAAGQAMRELTTVVSTVQDAETGQRGYLLTGRDDYLQPYKDATRVLPEHLPALRKLLDEPGAQALMQELDQAITVKMAE